MNNALTNFASQLADIMRDIDDKRVMAKALLDAAAEDGINVKALKKAAKELTMEAEKRAARYAEEAELDQMRAQLSLFPSDDRRAA